MATYLIGDVQGCYDTLQALLSTIDFRPPTDRIVLMGDLVNRGPKSVEVLQWVYENRGAVNVVLGNHDVHALAVFFGIRPLKRTDTLRDLIQHPQAELWFEWLRRQPLIRRQRGIWLVHAGLHPYWSALEALVLSQRIQSILSGELQHTLAFLQDSYRYRFDPQTQWHTLDEAEQLVAGFRVMLGVRAVWTKSGWPVTEFTGPPNNTPDGACPWYKVPTKRWSFDVAFGHWAAHGLSTEAGVMALDTGCVWGKQLTALRLDDGVIYQESAVD